MINRDYYTQDLPQNALRGSSLRAEKQEFIDKINILDLDNKRLQEEIDSLKEENRRLERLVYGNRTERA